MDGDELANAVRLPITVSPPPANFKPGGSPIDTNGKMCASSPIRRRPSIITMRINNDAFAKDDVVADDRVWSNLTAFAADARGTG